MKPLLILFALCGFAVPQAAQAPQPKVTNSSGSIQTNYVFSETVPYANPQTLAGDPPMMVPTMHDKVTHTRELGCDKGYEEDKLIVVDPATREISDYLDVCVKPSFIAQLRKAEQ